MAASAASDGLVGADGRRPILAWAGVSARPPPPMQPAHAGAGGAAAGRDGSRPPTSLKLGGAESAGARTDGDGFTAVPRRGRSATASPATQAGQPQAASSGDIGVAQAAATGTDGGVGGDGNGQLGASDVTTDQGRQGGPEAAGDEAGPTSEELKDSWQKAQKLVDLLVQQGLQPGDPVRDAAEQQADAAKRAGVGTEPGLGVSKRLVFAEQAPFRARKSQAKMEQSIDDLDMEYEAERARRQQVLADLRTRTREREEFLAQLSRQAAEEFHGVGAGADGDQARLVVETVDGPIRDAMQEALNSAPAGSDLRTRLEGAMGALAEVSTTISRAARGGWTKGAPHYYDLGGDDWGHDWRGDDGDYYEDHGQWYSSDWEGEHSGDSQL